MVGTSVTLSDVKTMGYRYLLGAILLVFLIVIAVPAQAIAGPLRVLILGGLLQLALRTGRRSRRWTWPALVLAGGLVVATIVAAVTGSPKALAIVTQVSTIVLITAAILVLATTVRASNVVDNAVVRGVLSIYLMLALLFAAIDEFGATLTPHYLRGVTEATPSNTLYFSIITIATVGYGDITPGNTLAQGVAATEALVGQLYLVSIVAVVISRYRVVRPGAGSESDAE